MTTVASVPTKIILFGEHFVVSGELDIVIAMEKRAYAARERARAEGGDCIIALTESKKAAQVEDAVKGAGGTTLIARKSDEGVQIER